MVFRLCRRARLASRRVARAQLDFRRKLGSGGLENVSRTAFGSSAIDALHPRRFCLAAQRARENSSGLKVKKARKEIIDMKKILIFAMLFTFSLVLISCSADSGTQPKSAANTNSSNTGAKPASAQPSPTADGKSDADKSANRMDDGKSDAD